MNLTGGFMSNWIVFISVLATVYFVGEMLVSDWMDLCAKINDDG